VLGLSGVPGLSGVFGALVASGASGVLVVSGVRGVFGLLVAFGVSRVSGVPGAFGVLVVFGVFGLLEMVPLAVGVGSVEGTDGASEGAAFEASVSALGAVAWAPAASDFGPVEAGAAVS
jgi:hypothetical protein